MRVNTMNYQAYAETQCAHVHMGTMHMHGDEWHCVSIVLWKCATWYTWLISHAK